MPAETRKSYGGLEGYLKLDGIDGECTDSKHKGWIEVVKYNLSMEQEGASRSAGGQSTVGRVNFNDFSIVKFLDKSAPKLAYVCAAGQHIPTAKFELCQSTKDKHPYMKYNLYDVVVSSIRTGAEHGDRDLPTEEVTLRFAKIEWEFTPMDGTGKVQAATKSNWNIKENTGG